MSEENRLKSSCWVGFGWEAARRGGSTWSHAVYRWDQKAVPPQAWLSAPRVVYRASSQVRNAWAASSE